MNLNKNLTLEEMQELISDYAFGKLSTNETIIFENNLKNYPEIIKEVSSIRSAFSKVNKAEIIENIERRTSNLTYKVNQREFENQQSKSTKKNIVRLALPILVVIIAFLILRNVNLNDNETKPISSEVILTSADVNIIIGDNAEISFYNPYYNEFYSEQETIETLNNTELINNSSNIIIYNYLNELSDSEFNKLIKELDDENFNL